MRGAFIGIDLACSSSLCIVRWVVGSRLRFLTVCASWGLGFSVSHKSYIAVRSKMNLSLRSCHNDSVYQHSVPCNENTLACKEFIILDPA